MMPRKRRKLAAASSRQRRPRARGRATTSSSDASPAVNLLSLPVEVLRTIIELACQRPPSRCACCRSSSNSTAQPQHQHQPLPHLHPPTLLSLSLTSQHLRSLVLAAQYRRISLSTPSALYSLSRTLTIRPELGELIHSLHIGPTGSLRPYWFPLLVDHWGGDGVRHCWVMTSLRAREMPSVDDDDWGEKECFVLDEGEEEPCNCFEAALMRALHSAGSSVRGGLGLVRAVHAGNQEHGEAEGIMQPVFILQAMLDLYVLAVRQMEEEKPGCFEAGRKVLRKGRGRTIPRTCREGKCGHFPALRIAPSEEHQDTVPKDAATVITVTPTQILNHLSRPGSDTDRFDHPLLYAQSGLSLAYTGASSYEFLDMHKAWASVRVSVPREEGEGEGAGWEENLSAFIDRGCQEGGDANGVEEEARPHDDDDEGLAAAKRRTPSIRSTLAWTHVTLSHTPNLSNLSLTGHLACVTLSPHLKLPSIRKLAIGPSPAILPSKLKLSRFAPDVEKLRVCGGMLGWEEREDLVAGLRALKKLEWSLLAKPNTKELITAIDHLAGHSDTNSSRTPRKRRRRLAAAPTSSSSCSASSPAPLPLVTIHLHPSSRTAILRAAPTQSVALAWQNGTAFLDAPRRLKLVSSDEGAQLEEEDVGVVDQWTSEVSRRHYDVGWRWWSGDGGGEGEGEGKMG